MEEYIFLHGLGQTAESWNGIKAKLPTENTHFIDLFAISDKAEMNYKNIYSYFENECEKFEFVNLCGISLGAVVAIDYTVNHLSKVNTLVLIAPQYKVSKLVLAFQNFMFQFLPESNFSSTGLSKSDVISLTNSMAYIDFSKELSDISCPALIICGENDIANISAARKLKKMLSNSKLFLFDGVSHEVNIEAPDKLAEVICKFYKFDFPRS